MSSCTPMSHISSMDFSSEFFAPIFMDDPKEYSPRLSALRNCSVYVRKPGVMESIEKKEKKAVESFLAKYPNDQLNALFRENFSKLYNVLVDFCHSIVFLPPHIIDRDDIMIPDNIYDEEEESSPFLCNLKGLEKIFNGIGDDAKTEFQHFNFVSDNELMQMNYLVQCFSMLKKINPENHPTYYHQFIYLIDEMKKVYFYNQTNYDNVLKMFELEDHNTCNLDDANFKKYKAKCAAFKDEIMQDRQGIMFGYPV